MFDAFESVDALKFNHIWNGVPCILAIINDYSGKNLCHFYMDAEALEKTLDTCLVHRYSREHKRTVIKGEGSENIMHVIEIDYDCDDDALSIKVIQEGPACHTGNYSCFYKRLL